MSFQPYNQNIPFASNAPSSDQPNMLENTNSIYNLAKVDHYGFEDVNGGTHQFVRWPLPVTPPATGTNEWSLFTGSSTALSDLAPSTIDLFFQGPNGGTIDTFLRNIGINGTANGYTQTFGGIILQWGSILSTGTSTPITFPLTFPNNLFSVIPTCKSNAVTYGVSSESTTGFSFIRSPTTPAVLIYWFAIGN